MKFNDVYKFIEQHFKMPVRPVDISKALNVSRSNINYKRNKNVTLNDDEIKKLEKYFNIDLTNAACPVIKAGIFAENLKKIRKELGLTVKELSEKTGCTENAINSYEQNLFSPSVKFCEQLYKKLSINLNWVFSSEGEMFVQPEKNFAAEYENVKADILAEVTKMMQKSGKPLD